MESTQQNDVPKLVSTGGPLFRKPDLSHEEFDTAWHRHGQLVTPWCVKSGVWEYIQIHMPPPPPPPPASPLSMSPSSSLATTTDEAGSRANDTVEARAELILRHADGVAIMRRYQVPTDAGTRYFRTVVLPDERRFLHDESGAGAVLGDPPVYDVPALEVDTWREMALRLGGVEYVKIRDGKDVVGNAFWGEWERVEKEREKEEEEKGGG
ncbi:hypothetical protein F5Y19DRAFT_268078 [Xylariaceae sp. FL1651]|nr:hypothetical protein F5Y19DRAFT_268078 [Xylariaceae sp. FL1651]